MKSPQPFYTAPRRPLQPFYAASPKRIYRVLRLLGVDAVVAATAAGTLTQGRPLEPLTLGIWTDAAAKSSGRPRMTAYSMVRIRDWQKLARFRRNLLR
jgi:hypothetical protein